MPGPRDRPIDILEQQYPAFPLPPLSVFVFSPFKKGTMDVRWSNPAELQANSKFNILGVNIYRSFDSEYGPYFRLNAVPVGSQFWRDRSTITVALNENVTRNFTSRGDQTGPNGDWVFQTDHKPISIVPTGGESDCTNLNIQVTINGVPAFVDYIDAANGVVKLLSANVFDVANQTQIPPVLPTNPTDVVLATYKYVANEIPTNLDIKIFYRVTTVAYDTATGALIETPLDRAAQSSNRDIEQLDYMWTEAIRRQRWLLQHGGEPVKVFIRKTAGPKCGCQNDIYKQPASDCLVCFGTGIIGGYDGPYDILISPDDGEKASVQTNLGRSISHPYDTWTLPSPQLSQRDFVVKLNGDRYGIGPVRTPNNRGMRLAQFFEISHLDEPDIRYQVQIPDPMFLRYPETRFIIPGRGDATPMITNSGVAPERQRRGNTATFENTNDR